MRELPPTLTDPAAEGDTALEGTTLGAYRIEKLLGEGAMGQVFLATHVALGRPVALKTLKPAVAADRSLTERFFAEARAVNIIRHENIVECTDLVNDPTGRSYIVMELLEGSTLGAAIREAGKLPAKRAVKIAVQIAEAIGAAHGKGIVHRDLKPENVYLIKRAGSRDYVKVLDFGIARLRPEYGGVSATQSGAVIGTPAYMSPEQVRGEKVGPAADIYALGVIVFQMLTGRLPFEASSMSMMLVAQLQETAPRVDKLAADVPRPLASLVEAALAKDASRRPADMSAFRRALLEAVDLPVESNASVVVDKALAATLPPSGAGHSSISGAAGEVARKPPRAALFGGGALVVAAAAVLLVTRPWASSPSQTNQPASANQPIVPTPVAPTPMTPAPATAAPETAATPDPTPAATVDAGVTQSMTDIAAKNALRAKQRADAKARADKALADKLAESGANVVTEPAKVDPPKDPKVDRSKQLVGPKVTP